MIVCKLSLHNWQSCQCSRCGLTRDAEHAYDTCTCRNCGKVSHSWSGCKCTKCRLTRDTEHAWNGCNCSRCVTPTIHSIAGRDHGESGGFGRFLVRELRRQSVVASFRTTADPGRPAFRVHMPPPTGVPLRHPAALQCGAAAGRRPGFAASRIKPGRNKSGFRATYMGGRPGFAGNGHGAAGATPSA